MKNYLAFSFATVYLLLIPSVSFSNDPKLTFKSDLQSVDFYVDGKKVGTQKGEVVELNRMISEGGGPQVVETQGSIPDGIYKEEDGELKCEIKVEDNKRSEMNKYFKGVLMDKGLYSNGQLVSITSYYLNTKISGKQYYKGTKLLRSVFNDEHNYDSDLFGTLYENGKKKSNVHYDTWECADKGIDRESKEANAFKIVAKKHSSSKKKESLPEEARKYSVQAQSATNEKRFRKAADLYKQALELAPWWPQGHYNRALLLDETNQWGEAIAEMKKYLLLEPNAKDARAAKDQIYQWEGRSGK